MTDRAKYLLESIEGLNWLAIVPLVVFFILFIVLVYLTYNKNRKSYNDYMANLPLEEKEHTADYIFIKNKILCGKNY